MIKENLEEVKKEIENAAKSANRDPSEITLIAVTKLHPVEEINEAISAGVTDIGENKVQEVLNKYEFVNPVRWHLIGHLQTNKVKYIVDKAFLIHSVDSVHLAVEIDKQAKKINKVQNILLQVNTAKEDSKSGIYEEDLEAVLNEILATCDNVKIMGLMCIAPFDENPENVKVYFDKAKALYDKYGKIEHKNLEFKYLSMGMSNDFDVAIKAGSNMVRVGTAIFGQRDYSKKMA